MATFMNTVPNKPKNPTVQVIINGLALLCFSRKYNQAEVGFLKLTEPQLHPLLFTIYEPNCRGIKFHTVIESGTININSDTQGIGSLYYPEPTDENDFRKVLSLDEIHKRFSNERVTIKADNDYLAKLFIQKGIFFNAALSNGLGRIFHRDDILQTVVPAQKIGKVYGAYIDDEVVNIKIDSVAAPIPTLTRSTSPYTIIIRYKCADERATETDFQRFYDTLKQPLPAGHQICDLEYGEIEEPYRHDCERGEINEFETNEEFKTTVEGDKSLAMLFNSFFFAREACEGTTKPDCPENLLGEPEPC